MLIVNLVCLFFLIYLICSIFCFIFYFRDIKPDNILLDESGKFTDDTSVMTMTMTILNTIQTYR